MDMVICDDTLGNDDDNKTVDRITGGGAGYAEGDDDDDEAYETETGC